MNKRNTEYIITGALIAAAYAGLTYLSAIFNLAYGPFQIRISEVLTILPLFTPAAIPGLTVGCFLANIGSFNPLDLIFGSVATLLAATLTYYLKDIKFKGIPLLSLFPPVIVNAVVIGLEIAVFMPKTPLVWGLLISALQVGISELIVCVGLGIPFYLTLVKLNMKKRILRIRNK